MVTALGPALLGWIVCAQFASVALSWTFYFVLGIWWPRARWPSSFVTERGASLVRAS